MSRYLEILNNLIINELAIDIYQNLKMKERVKN